MNTQQQVIKDAYNGAAVAYREKYDEIPVRTKDVDTAFSFVATANPHVLEIGCAYGREAQYILTKTPHYTGIDIAEQYIKMAKAEVKGGMFECVDVLEYSYEHKLDIVFAFASLLHLDKEHMRKVLRDMHQNLNSDGIIFLSLKRRDSYSSELMVDQHSERIFYYYNRETILELCDGLYSEVFCAEQTLKESWFTMILKKRDI